MKNPDNLRGGFFLTHTVYVWHDLLLARVAASFERPLLSVDVSVSLSVRSVSPQLWC